MKEYYSNLSDSEKYKYIAIALAAILGNFILGQVFENYPDFQVQVILIFSALIYITRKEIDFINQSRDPEQKRKINQLSISIYTSYLFIFMVVFTTTLSIWNKT